MLQIIKKQFLFLIALIFNIVTLITCRHYLSLLQVAPLMSFYVSLTIIILGILIMNFVDRAQNRVLNSMLTILGLFLIYKGAIVLFPFFLQTDSEVYFFRNRNIKDVFDFKMNTLFCVQIIFVVCMLVSYVKNILKMLERK